VQETLLRAWRSYGTFDEGRASLRTWLYRIATNACLTALEHRSRRPLPSGLTAPGDDPAQPLETEPGVAWLQPIPDALLTGAQDDPATIVATRGSVRLALVAALQHLPARQRAVLILRDVLAWRAGEVADVLDTTTAAVNSALQRARAQLADVAPVEDEVSEPDEPAHRELLDRYMAAFENADVAELTRLLRHDVQVEMPPYRTWFAGIDAVGPFLAARAAAHRWRMVPTRANGQPAVVSYLARPDGSYRNHSVQVLTVLDGRITRIVAFQDPGLFATFGLPLTPPAGRVAAAVSS